MSLSHAQASSPGASLGRGWRLQHLGTDGPPPSPPSNGCWCFSSCWSFSILEAGRMGRSPGIQGVEPGSYSDSGCGCWGGLGWGGCGQETGAFPPSVGAEGSAYHRPGCGRTGLREPGPSDSSLLREAPGTLGPCARRSVTLPTAGENFPRAGPGPRHLLGPQQDRGAVSAALTASASNHTGYGSFGGGGCGICFNFLNIFRPLQLVCGFEEPLKITLFVLT